MRTADWLNQNRLLVALSAVVTVVGTINSFTSSFRMLPAFFTDFAAAALLATVATLWVVKRPAAETSVADRAAILTPDGRPAIYSRKKPPRDEVLFVLPVLFVGGLAIWNILTPTVHVLTRRDWVVCGTISSKVRRPCFRFIDTRGRPVHDECVYPMDDSGYFRIVQSRWWQYRPERVAMEASASVPNSARIDNTFFDSSCSGFMEFP